MRNLKNIIGRCETIGDSECRSYFVLIDYSLPLAKKKKKILIEDCPRRQMSIKHFFPNTLTLMVISLSGVDALEPPLRWAVALWCRTWFWNILCDRRTTGLSEFSSPQWLWESSLLGPVGWVWISAPPLVALWPEQFMTFLFNGQ